MKKLLLLLMSFFMPLQAAPYLNTPCDETSSKEDQIVNRILATLAKRLSKKYNMHASGDRASMPEGVIRLVGLSFQIYRPLTQDEARVILLDCVNELLKEINTDAEIRPHLKTYPFTPKNIDISIFIYDSKGRDIYYPYLGLITARADKLNYITYKQDSKLPKYQTQVTESFEEAISRTHF